MTGASVGVLMLVRLWARARLIATRDGSDTSGHARARQPHLAAPHGHQKSIRITTRRNVGRVISVKPASANTFSVPTWSSSAITFFVVIG
jgi:hypothetical protein